MKRISVLAILSATSALTTMGCMSTPNNGDSVGASTSPVQFAGYSLNQVEEVAVFAGPTPSGPWTQILQTLSGSTALTYDNTPLYGWSIQGVIPPVQWSSGEGAVMDTYIFAKGFAQTSSPSQSSETYFSFDNAAISPNHEDWFTCVQNEDKIDGNNLRTSVTTCASKSTPIVHVTAPRPALCGSITTAGNVTVAAGSDLNALKCIGHITGNLVVDDSTAPPDVEFPSLTAIDGSATLGYSPAPQMGTLRTINMPALKTIGGALDVSVVRFPDGDTLKVGADALSSVGGGVSFMAMTRTVTMAGLPSLTRTPSVAMQFDGDVNLHDLLPNLTVVTGDVHVGNAVALHDVLPALTEVDGTLAIVYMAAATLPPDSIGFGQLTTVGATLHLENTPWPQFGGAAPAFAKLSSVGQALEVLGTNLTTLQIGTAATKLTVGSLNVTGNPTLTTMNPTSIAVASSGAITIQGNSTLPQCEADNYVAAQSALGWAGAPSTGGNGDTNPSDCPSATPNVLVVTTQGGGTVTDATGAISCGTACTGYYAAGASVTLTAKPASGFAFNGWTGGACSGTGTVCTVPIAAATSVVASFVSTAGPPPPPPPMYTLAVTLVQEGQPTVQGTVTAQSADGNSLFPACVLGFGDLNKQCSVQVPAGTKVTLGASFANFGRFDGFDLNGNGGGFCTPAVGTNGGSCSFTVTGDTSVGARFQGIIW